KAVDIVYQDFAKAFDKVQLKRLVLKLETNEITGNTLKWISNWLQDRRQKVG
ncbi:hypothetical protein HELRODRAFT_128747, partial [Helobdella robusta]|uniref:Reverse transcriptase domain-containing protein n=1 Tax=Helobdella robusta TaxID=6412 RepID=T1EHQ5_HELRO